MRFCLGNFAFLAAFRRSLSSSVVLTLSLRSAQMIAGVALIAEAAALESVVAP